MNLTSPDYATIVLRVVLIGRLTNLRCARSILNVNGATDVCRFVPIDVAMNVFVVGGCWCKPGYVEGVRNCFSSRKAPQCRNSKVVARVERPSLVLGSFKGFDVVIRPMHAARERFFKNRLFVFYCISILLYC